jgi:hypothetical protein
MRDLTGFGKDRPITVYIVPPTGKLKTQMVWLRLLIQSAIAAFRDHPRGGAAGACLCWMCSSFKDKGGSFQAACTAAPLASAINSSTDHWS